MRLKKTTTTCIALTLLLLILFMSACEQPIKELQLADLTPDEYTYVERFVVLERAKAVALNDRELGNTVLDSLALAWGDSAEARTAALAPIEPIRSKAVHALLKRIVIAEHDSLMQAPSVHRLSAPLSDSPALTSINDH